MFVITGGQLKNKSLHMPPKSVTRPTSSRAREGVFNILMHRFLDRVGRSILKDALILDLFSGSGSLGLEALSRGARFCVFCETHPEALAVLRHNIAHLGQEQNTLVLPHSPLSLSPAIWGSMERPSVIFMDPPYHQNLIPLTLENVLVKQFYSQGSLLVTESSREEPVAKQLFEDSVRLNRSYGTAQFHFIQHPH